MLKIKQVDVNRLAQRFFENCDGLSMAMVDKPKIIAGLTAVFKEMGIEVYE